MILNGLLQLVLYFLVLLAITKPLGLYMAKVFSGERTFMDKLLGPLERLIYRICGVDERQEQHWTAYTVAMLLFNLVGLFALYGLQRLQYYLPFNPQELTGIRADTAFNTAVSFTTNTNWQAYSGETTMSYLTQMAGLAFHNFVSAATGIALAIALVRGIARHEARTVGNFWVDMTRTTLYVLFPLSIVGALLLVSQGVIQNFNAYTKVTLVEPQQVEVQKEDGTTSIETRTEQIIAQGPVASQIIIKQLGTNGGGFFNVNSSHPYENPTPFSNFLEMLAILAISSGLTYTFGRMVRNQKHGWALFWAMAILFLAGVFIAYYYETRGNPIFNQHGVTQATIETDGSQQSGGNMEGKEVRYGILNSVVWAVATTDASNGSVNSMHDSYTPLSGMIPLLNILLGEVIFGGVGAGLYGILVMVVLTVFIAGLMVGRTPEYLGKKIEAKEVKMAMLYTLIFALSILVFTGWACVIDAGLLSRNNLGPHGLSEILYAYTSGTGNNGSAFAGLNANTLWYNTTTGLAMLIGRFFMIIPMMGIAGSLATKKITPPSAGTLPVHTPLFVGLVIGIILIVGALTFFPVLCLGPIVEHFLMEAGILF
jgi:K+-transporting ATPase ATPase A chain